MPAKPQIAIVGPGRLGGALSLALTEAGYRVSEVISRDTPSSQKRARDIARKTRSLTSTLETADLKSDLIWFCVPDREIARAARALSPAGPAVTDPPTPRVTRGPRPAQPALAASS